MNCVDRLQKSPLGFYEHSASEENCPMSLPPQTQRIEVTETSTLAIVSLVLGILSVVLCLGPLAAIPAVICGHLAVSGINRSHGRITGGGMAITGLVLGYAMIAVSIMAVVAALVFPAFTHAKGRASEAMSLSYAGQLAMACILYAEDHDGALPETLEVLFEAEDRMLDPGMKSPFAAGQDSIGYELMLSGKVSQYAEPSKTVLIREINPSPRGQRAVAYLDGHAELVVEPDG
jgi:hypothetical protein